MEKEKEWALDRPLVPLSAGAAIALSLAVSTEKMPTLYASVILLTLCGAATWLGRRHKWLLVLGLLVVGVCGSLCLLAWHHERVVQPLRALNGQSHYVTAYLVRDAEQYEQSQRALLRVDPLASYPHRFRVQCSLPRTEQPLLAGDGVQVQVVFYVPDSKEGFDRAAYQAANGCYIAAAYEDKDDGTPFAFTLTRADPKEVRLLPARLSRALKQSIVHTMETRKAGLLIALLLGDKTYLDENDALSLRIAGLSHLIAVSGMHIGFLVGFCYFVFGRQAGTWLCMPLLTIFVPMAGATPSVVRAAIMYLVSAAGFVLHKQTDSLNALCAAFLLLLVQNPYAIASTSLQLSFTATLGLLLLAPRLQKQCMRPFRHQRKWVRRVLRAVVSTVVCAVSSTVLTAPVLLASFGWVSVLSPLSNLLILPLTALCFVAGLVQAIGGIWFPVLVSPIAAVVSCALDLMLRAAEWVAGLPFGLVDGTGKFEMAALALYLGVATLWAVLGARMRPKYTLPVVTLVIVGLIGVQVYDDAAHYTVTYLPCGSGQAILIADPSGHTTLIDCAGNGSYRNAAQLVYTWLRWHNRSRIDTLVLTALDKGHARDFDSLLHTVEVGEIYVPSGSKPNKNTRALVERIYTEPVNEVEDVHTLRQGCVPITLFLVTQGKLGVQIGQSTLVLHSPTQKQLDAFLDEHTVTAPTVVLSSQRVEQSTLLRDALASLGAARVILQTGWGEPPHKLCGLPVRSPYTEGELTERYAWKEDKVWQPVRPN